MPRDYHLAADGDAMHSSAHHPDPQRHRMARPRKCWSHSEGSHGHRCTVYERTSNGPLWLKWWEPARTKGERGRWRYRALSHHDKPTAIDTAKALAGQLLASTLAAEYGKATVADVFAAYGEDVAQHLRGQGPREARRHMKLWTAFLGANRDALAIDFPSLDRYVRERLAGRIRVAGVKLKAAPSPRAIQADFTTLQAALNHATRVVRPNGSRLLASNPAKGFEPPRTRNPRRPVATFDRYLSLIEHADAIDAQRLFCGFMGLVEALGWRVSAICQLRASHIDRTAQPVAPDGRIYKAPQHDKEHEGGWLPLSPDARAAVDLIFARHAEAGRLLVGDAPLFPAPRAQAGEAKPWDRYHARTLLERAEAAAELPAIEGSDFHCFRRKWATERKHLPAQDVAHAGSWRDLRCLQTAYTQPDAETVLAVVSAPVKLRDPAAVQKAAK